MSGAGSVRRPWKFPGNILSGSVGNQGTTVGIDASFKWESGGRREREGRETGGDRERGDREREGVVLEEAIR